MGYAETLAKIVEKSGLTLREITLKCLEDGVKIDPSYISKLQTGKQAPASDEVNIAIAKACNIDPEILIYESFIEKAPDFVRDFMNKLLNTFRDITKRMTLSQVPEQMMPYIEKSINDASDLELIKTFIHEDLILPEKENDYFLMKDHVNEEVKTFINPMLGLIMPDDSMEPIIKENAHLQLDSISSIKNGDIIVVILNEQSYIIRRYIQIEDKVILIPENRKYVTTSFNGNEIVIAGRVKSVTTEL